MAQFSKYDLPPATVIETLESQTVDQLKHYQQLISDGKGKPGRKAERVGHL